MSGRLLERLAARHLAASLAIGVDIEAPGPVAVGDSFWAEISIADVRADGSRPAGVVAAAVDVAWPVGRSPLVHLGLPAGAGGPEPIGRVRVTAAEAGPLCVTAGLDGAMSFADGARLDAASPGRACIEVIAADPAAGRYCLPLAAAAVSGDTVPAAAAVDAAEVYGPRPFGAAAVDAAVPALCDVGIMACVGRGGEL